MENNEYLGTQNILLAITQGLKQLDLKGFHDAIVRAETIAPFVDPTLYQKAGSRLGLIKKLAELGMQMQKVREELQDKLVEDLLKQAMRGESTP